MTIEQANGIYYIYPQKKKGQIKIFLNAPIMADLIKLLDDDKTIKYYVYDNVKHNERNILFYTADEPIKEDLIKTIENFKIVLTPSYKYAFKHKSINTIKL